MMNEFKAFRLKDVIQNDKDGLNFTATLQPVSESDTETVRLIAGRLNSCCQTYYWLLEEDEKLSLGDYAIVENLNDYDLVKIVGVVETNKKYLKKLTNQNICKKVVNIVNRENIRED